MTKDKDHHVTPIHAAKPEAPPVPAGPPEAPKCVVCGQSSGALPGSVGPMRWHAECEAARPDVIAKAKARA